MSKKRGQQQPIWGLPWSARARQRVGQFGNGMALLPRRKSTPRRGGRRK